MSSKAARRRRKRPVQADNLPSRPVTAETTQGPPAGEIARPTAERLAKGIWTVASRSAPAVDDACDYIGRLYAMKLIEYHHHEAARMFQDIVAAFMADLPIAGFRSCLAGGTGAYDSGDGNPAAVKAYDAMKRKLGAVRFAYLRTQVDKPSDAPIKDVDVLRNALEAVAR